MMPGDREGGADLFLRKSPSRAIDGVLRLDTAATFPAQVGLKFLAIFPQIMKQPGEFRFAFVAERGGELTGQGGHVAEVSA
jgi:hypothetical protein